MRGARVKQLREGLLKEWPMLVSLYGRKLKSFRIVFKQIKQGYKDKFSIGGYKLARTR